MFNFKEKYKFTNIESYNSTCYKGGMHLIFAKCSLGQQITRGENGHPPEKHTILFFRPIIANIIIVKKSWLGKEIVQWRRRGGARGGALVEVKGANPPPRGFGGVEPPTH